jgi:hypothetical protein
MVANHHISYRKALAWMGHADSEMLANYYNLHDDEAEQSMRALADDMGGEEKALADLAITDGHTARRARVGVTPKVETHEANLNGGGQEPQNTQRGARRGTHQRSSRVIPSKPTQKAPPAHGDSPEAGLGGRQLNCFWKMLWRGNIIIA